MSNVGGPSPVKNPITSSSRSSFFQGLGRLVSSWRSQSTASRLTGREKRDLKNSMRLVENELRASKKFNYPVDRARKSMEFQLVAAYCLFRKALAAAAPASQHVRKTTTQSLCGETSEPRDVIISACQVLKDIPLGKDSSVLQLITHPFIQERIDTTKMDDRQFTAACRRTVNVLKRICDIQRSPNDYEFLRSNAVVTTNSH